jgi:putative FmdB family regulatory protein
MPIYEYECSICSCHFDKRQNFSDEPVAVCPKCNGKSRRVLVPAPVIFKGSGFYVTDYPSSGAKGSSSATSSKTPDSSQKPSPKPATKPSPSPSPS